MRLRIFLMSVAAVAALAGCDRRDQKPMNTAAQQAAPEARTAQPSNPAPEVTRPDQSASPPRPDSATGQEPQAQGQADARQGEQKEHFDNKR